MSKKLVRGRLYAKGGEWWCEIHHKSYRVEGGHDFQINRDENRMATVMLTRPGFVGFIQYEDVRPVSSMLHKHGGRRP